MIRVGTAGWSYPDWDGAVYPRSKPHGFHGLSYLSRFVDCIEVNSSFYALPRAESSSAWVRHVAEREGFRFLVKLLRDFTHGEAPGREAAGWDELARAFLDGIAPIRRARRLAGLLIQFPAGFLYGREEVRRLGHIAALFGELPLAVELRHVSWFEPPALATLRGMALSLLHIDLPEAWNHPPPWHEPTGPLGYLRLHGRNSAQWFRRGAGRDDRYDYLYSPRELGPIVERARRLSSRCDETFVVTNNHFGGQAVANALEIRAALSGESVPAPPELVARFPRLAACTHAVGQQRLF